ncbi:uncharacterized protein [Macrobrachium rosenbergii]|uniref:uncharacterized protein n=1 Tax=Macrobrachium rosenbergii TaxID=79674 RepID=UPI0034D68E7D
MEPFRDLLRKPTGKNVYWDSQLCHKPRQAQEVICQLAKNGLAYYDKTRPTIIMTHWSKEGFGFVVLQQYCACQSADSPFCCKGGWRLTLCGSRHLTPTEAGYAPLEGEAFALTWCLQKARLFLLGCPNLTIITGHGPLVKLLGDRALKDVINPRLFTLKEKTLQFRFHIKYLPGKRNTAVDFLAKYPAMRSSHEASDVDLEDDIQVAVACATVVALEQDTIVLDEDCVRSATSNDPVYQLLLARVAAGDWPQQQSQEVACLHPFFSVRDRLAINLDLVTYSVDQGYIRLVILEDLRRQVATNLRAGRQGLDSMLRRARQSVYWPGIEGDLQHHHAQCTSCDEHARHCFPKQCWSRPQQNTTSSKSSQICFR